MICLRNLLYAMICVACWSISPSFANSESVSGVGDLYISSFKEEMYKSSVDDMGKFIIYDILVFLIGASLYYIFVERRNKGRRYESVLKFLFPRHVLKSRTFKTDIWNFAFRRVFATPFFATGFAVIAFLIGGSLNEALIGFYGRRSPVTDSLGIVVAVQFLSILLAKSLSEYWVHRLMHDTPIFWSFHRVHHSAEALSIFTRGRTTFGELLIIEPILTGFASLGLGLSTYLLGAELNPWAISILFVVNMTTGIYAVFTHTHIPVSFGKLNYIFAGPVLHHIHHSAERRHHDKNYATDFAL